MLSFRKPMLKRFGFVLVVDILILIMKPDAIIVGNPDKSILS